MELEITFSLISKLACADGAVSKTEVTVVEKLIDNILKLGPEEKNQAIAIFNKAKKSSESFADYAHKYKVAMQAKPEMLSWMLDLLVKISYADKSFSEKEVELLKLASQIFEVPLTKYEKYFEVKNIDAELALVGCDASHSYEQIEEKFNQLCEQYSPDKIRALGLPKEFIELAEVKVRQFSEAFSEIKKYSGK